MFVMFDLPVKTKPQRKAAHNFRIYLLKQGFQMAQLSIYMKSCRDQVQVERITIQVSKAVPSNGRLDVITITDKQYEKIVTFYGEDRIKRENPSNLTLF